MKRSQIHITFIDAETGKAIGEMYSSREDMPKAFEPQKTTLNLEGTLWVLIKAEPATADEYIRTGKVTVTLEKVKHLPAQSILYTLPTICDAIPKVQPSNQQRKEAVPVLALPAEQPMPEKSRYIRPQAAHIQDNIYRIHEDYWRQIEFVSLGYQKAIEAEMNEIGLIYRDHSNNNRGTIGFTKIHIRKQIPQPIAESFQIEVVRASMPQESHQYIGIGYGGAGSMEADGLIEDGFAFQVGPLVVYGISENDLVKILCLHDHGEKSIPSQVVTALLERIMLASDLAVIDWCRGIVLLPGRSTVQDYVEKVFY